MLHLASILDSVPLCRGTHIQILFPMAAYRYNGRDEELATFMEAFTSRIGNGLGDPEEDYLSTLQLVACCRPRASLVDIGCGLGRVIGLLNSKVESMVGLEPDFDRFSDCCKAYHDGCRIQILNTTSDRYKTDFPHKLFDIGVVSMVIQHVSTNTCHGILSDLHDLLSDDGIGVVATTLQEVERFTLETDPAPLSESEFNRYAEDVDCQASGILPVRQFSRESFLGTLSKAGLETIRWGQFSYMRADHVDWFASYYSLNPDDIRDVGTSQYSVVRKYTAARVSE